MIFTGNRHWNYTCQHGDNLINIYLFLLFKSTPGVHLIWSVEVMRHFPSLCFGVKWRQKCGA